MSLVEIFGFGTAQNVAMRKEKIILSTAAVLIGILVAVGLFFFYQSTRQLRSTQIKKITIETPTPSQAGGMFLSIDSPKDEEVVSNREIKVSGKTVPNANIVILGGSFEEAAQANKDGDFSTSITLSANENILEISAIAPNGESAKAVRVVTYSTENF